MLEFEKTNNILLSKTSGKTNTPRVERVNNGFLLMLISSNTYPSYTSPKYIKHIYIARLFIYMSQMSLSI